MQLLSNLADQVYGAMELFEEEAVIELGTLCVCIANGQCFALRMAYSWCIITSGSIRRGY